MVIKEHSKNLPLKIVLGDKKKGIVNLLIEQGGNLKYDKTQLKHSNPTVTLNAYANLMKPTNKASAIKLELAVFNSYLGHSRVTEKQTSIKILKRV